MKAQAINHYLLAATLFILVFGTIVLASASSVISQKNFNQPHYYIGHQLLFGILPGLAALFCLQKINYRFWQKISLILIVLGIILTSLVFVPGLGLKLGGSSRWLDLKISSFQPSELLKLCFVIYLAAALSKKNKKYWQILIFTGLIFLLLSFQPDVGTLALIIALALVMHFAAGIKLRFLIIAIIILALLGLGLIKTSVYRSDRISAFLYPDAKPQGIGYQVRQSLLAIGSGGTLGLGAGQSRQKLNFLPEPAGDSIFAILAEEWGLLGSLFIIILFFFFAWQGLRVAKRAPDHFGQLLAIGITSWIFIQASINIMALMRLLPLTGIPLPLISYGGSAMIITLAGIGILINISKA